MDTFAPIPGVKSNGKPYSIPPTSKLSTTSHNESYTDGSPTSPLSFTSSTPPSTGGTSTPGGSSRCPGDTGQPGCTAIPAPAPIANPVLPVAAPVIVAGGPPDPSPLPPPGSGPGSVADFDNMSVSGSSTSSASSGRGCAPQPQIPTGRFHLPDLTSLMDTVAYEMWKNTIGFFHLGGHTDELIMPIAYQSIKGDVALDIVTHGPHMNLRDLIAHLDNNFGVVSDEDTLMKELYTIKQGTKESVKHVSIPVSAMR